MQRAWFSVTVQMEGHNGWLRAVAGTGDVPFRLGLQKYKEQQLLELEHSPGFWVQTEVSSLAIRFPAVIKFLTSTCFHLIKKRTNFPLTSGEHVKCQQIFLGQIENVIFVVTRFDLCIYWVFAGRSFLPIIYLEINTNYMVFSSSNISDGSILQIPYNLSLSSVASTIGYPQLAHEQNFCSQLSVEQSVRSVHGMHYSTDPVCMFCLV